MAGNKKGALRKFKNQKQFEDFVYNQVGNEYTVLSKYEGTSYPIKIKHNKCGHISNSLASSFIEGHRCSYCQHKVSNKKRTKNTNYFKTQVKSLTGDEYTVLGEYTKAINKVLIRHNKCGNEYMVAPVKFVRCGRRCPKCQRIHSNRSRTKDTAWFSKKVLSLLGSNYKVTGTYKKADIPIEIQHLTCGRCYNRTPRTIIDSQVGCPYCGCLSRGERLVRDYLEEHEFEYQSQKSFPDLKDSSKLSYDFYLPIQNILIEYQGIQHYKPREFFGIEYFNTQKLHDRLKADYAKKNGYRLILIKYTYNSKLKVNGLLNRLLKM